MILISNLLVLVSSFVYNILIYLMFANSSVNFYLYLFVNKRFRNDFAALLRLKRVSSRPLSEYVCSGAITSLPNVNEALPTAGPIAVVSRKSFDRFSDAVICNNNASTVKENKFIPETKL